MSPTPTPADPADGFLSSYAFELPDELIAQQPVEPRHAARLLVVEPDDPGQPTARCGTCRGN